LGWESWAACPLTRAPFSLFDRLSTPQSAKELPLTLDEAIQTVVAARMQYYTVHAQVHQLREAWALQHALLLAAETLHKQTMSQAEDALRTLALAIY